MTLDLHEALGQSVRSEDDADGRIGGFRSGVIVDVNDPRSLGRVRARIEGQEKGSASTWLDPMWPGAMEGVPRVGDPIYVAFVNEDPNRGLYCCAPRTTTQNRPTEFMVLGNILVSLFNRLVDIYKTHTHQVSGVDSGTFTATSGVPNHLDAWKGLAADGSVVPSASQNSIVLSGEAKVR